MSLSDEGLRQAVMWFGERCDQLVSTWRGEVSAELADYAAMLGLSALVMAEAQSKQAGNDYRIHRDETVMYDGTEPETQAEKALTELLTKQGRLPKPEVKP